MAYLKGDGYWHRPLEKEGASVHYLGAERYANPQAVLRLRILIRDLGPVVVHAHMPPAEVYSRLALVGISAKTSPLIVTKHNHEPFWPSAIPVGIRLGRWVARRASATIAISEAVAERIRAEGLIPRNGHLSVIHYGLDPKPFQQVEWDAVERLRHAWGATPDTVVYGTVARLVPQKSLDTLLEAFAELSRRAAVRSRLVVVGTGPLEGELKATAEALGISRKCVWAGFREDIPLVMNAFDAFVLSSAWEGLGLVLLEAMAAGRPIAASRVDAVPEVVQDGRTGYLVPPRDPSALARALEALLDRAARTRLGAEGRKRIAQFSLGRMVERVSAVYRAAQPAAES